MARIKLLLINPRYLPSFWTFEWVVNRLWSEIRYTVAPLGLASVAALTPSAWEIRIVDENVETLNLNLEADVVGVAGMSSQVPRQRQILEHFKAKGCHVVAGGNHASLLPEHYDDVADTVIAGEAEYVWPRFCRDFEAGTPAALYRETGNVEMADSPTPRFELLNSRRYLSAALQFSRGCPFRCEFCDIIVVFGRRPRTKSPDQIGRELDELRRQGIRNVFFVDDNLIGHKPKCKELLRYLVEYQRRHDYRFFFGTEASINLAGDDELLELFRAANFGYVFIGIESPDEEALKETLKFQNTGLDLVQSVRKIYSYGISVQAGFIIGFDADDAGIFERQFRFIQEAGICIPMVGLLVAIARTPLWDRLEKAGRLRTSALPRSALEDGAPADNTLPATNIIPLKMSYRELVSGYAGLVRRLFTEEAMVARIGERFAYLERPLPGHHLPLLEQVRVTLRFLGLGVMGGGPRRCLNFLRSLAWTRGRYDRLVALIEAWINSVALKEYVDRVFDPANVESCLAEAELELAGTL